jgi:nucleoside-diphosphate-sugar epimerase
MGGASSPFPGEHDAGVMQNSAAINLNMLDACHTRSARRVFYSSSACMYPAYNQEAPLHLDRSNPGHGGSPRRRLGA